MENNALKEELAYYKETIDIRDYLESAGYVIDKSRDTPRYRAYTNQALEDKVYIPKNSRNGVANFYVNQHNNDDKGTLVDFIMSREHKSLQEARLTLRAFQPGFKPVEVQQPAMEEENEKKKRQQYMVHKIATEYPSGLDEVYLEKRLLTADTRHHPAFVDKIKLNELDNEKWMVFPLENKEGKPTGLAMKRDGQEKILGEKSGVWLSHPTQKDRLLDKLVITEHPIDAMSYHQLHEAKHNQQNVIYIATAGNPSVKQIDLIQEKIQTLHPKEVVLANDHDQAGQQYNGKYQEKLKDLGARIYIEIPQFKDWNADVYAGALYQSRLLDRSAEQPHKIHVEGKQKISPELEEIIQQKDYKHLTPEQKQHLPHMFIEKQIGGRSVEYSLKEIALINNDQKLSTLLKQPAQEIQMNQAFVAGKTQKVEENVRLNDRQERAVQITEDAGTREKRVAQIDKQNHQAQEAFRSAENYIKGQNEKVSSTPTHHQENTVSATTDSFLETQRRYNQQIDVLQQQITGNPSHDQLSRKLYYYKNYPHLNDQEVDTYLSIEDEIKDHQQDHSQGLGRQKDREIGI